LDRIGTPSKIKVAICESGTYGPKSNCSNNYVGTSGISSQNNYLNKEWDQLLRMGRNPTALLGVNPPW
jgi:hypothetical protein